jgi:2-succinyl-6-hydroxy-2,4-cyclohexadiene-1-carboxylate synthase
MPDGSSLILLLHGFTHTGASWRPVVEQLPAGFRAVTPDIRGHGTASGRRPADLTAVLAELSELIAEPGLVAGYSMGGRLALHLALHRSEAIDRLVLIGASPGLADAGERQARRKQDEQLADEIERSSIEEFTTRWAQTPVLGGLPAQVAAQVQQDRLRSAPAGLAAALRGLGTGALPSLWERLPEVAVPVFLVVGERDQKFQAIARNMAESIPQAEVVVVAGAGHAVHLEAPDRVAEIISGRR